MPWASVCVQCCGPHLFAAQHDAEDVGVHNCLQVFVIALEQRSILVRVRARIVDPVAVAAAVAAVQVSIETAARRPSAGLTQEL
jgi:hypothetical protein